MALLLAGTVMVAGCGGGNGDNGNGDGERPTQQNQAPTANAGEDQTKNPGATVTLSGSGSDPENSTLSYSWQQTSEGSGITLSGARNPNATFVAPAVTEVTVFTFRLTVTDAGGLSDTDDVSITVNAPPTANAGTDEVVNPGATVTLNGSGTDPGDGELSYSWQLTSEGNVTLSDARASNPTFIAPMLDQSKFPSVITLTFQLTVTNENNLTAEDSVSISVRLPTVAIDGHNGTVRGVSISRNGGRAVSGGSDGSLRLWNVNTSSEILFGDGDGGMRSLGGHDAEIYAVSLNADGSRALSGGADGTVRLWDTQAGEELRFDMEGASEQRSLGTHSLWVYAVALSRDGSRAVSGGFDGKLRFWNTINGTEIRYPGASGSETRNLGNLGASAVYAIALSDDGSRALSGGADGSVILWNTVSGEAETTLSSDDSIGSVYAVALSGDGTLAMAGGADNELHIWNAQDGTKIHALTGHTADISSISLSADKTRALTSGGDGTVRLWNTNTDANGLVLGTELHAVRRHTDYVWSVALSGDGAIALSGGADGMLNLWDTATEPTDTEEPFHTTELETSRYHSSNSLYLRELADDVYGHVVNDMVLSADGRIAALSIETEDTVRLWNTSTGESLPALEHTYWVGASSLNANGDRVLSGTTSDGSLHIWDATTGTILRSITGHNGVITDVTLSADGHRALSRDRDGVTLLWDATNGNLLHTLTVPTGRITNAALSADGSRALLVADADSVLLWDATSGELLHTLEIQEGTISSVALSSDGRIAALGASDGTVHLWETVESELLHTISIDKDPIDSVSLSADGRIALSRSQFNRAHLWDVNTGEYLSSVGNFSDKVVATSLSADGTLALLLDADNAMTLWRIGRPSTTRPTATATAMANQDLEPGDEVTLVGSSGVHAVNGVDFTYSWRQTAGPTVNLSAPNTATATFTAPLVATDTTVVFSLIITSSRGLVATNEASITLRNAAPTANAGSDQNTGSWAEVTLIGSGSSDPGNGTLTYSWSQTAGPTVTLSADDDVSSVFIAPAVTTSITLTFELTVEDTGGLSATDSVSVVVASNAPPRAVAGADQNVESMAVVTLDGSGSTDPGPNAGGGSISYSWEQVSGSTVTLSATDVPMPTFTAPAVDGRAIPIEMVLTFKLTAKDADDLTSEDSVSVFVGRSVLAADDHGGTVRSVAITKNGTRAVSGGSDGTVRLWNANTGEALPFADGNGGMRPLGDHDDEVYAVAISDDGSRILSGGADGTVRLWNAENGEEIRYDMTGGSGKRSLGAHGIWVYAVALNENGSRAVSGGFDGKVRFWDTTTGAEVRYEFVDGSDTHGLGNHGDNSVYAVALNDDGTRALSGGADGTVRLWNTATGELERVFRDGDAMGPVYGVSLSGDGSVAASGGADNNVHVWNTENGIETYELIGHEADVSSVRLNEDNTRVLSSGGDGTVRVWNVDADDAMNGTEIRTLRRHTNYVWSTDLGDRGVAVSGGADGLVHFWDTAAQPMTTTEPFAPTEPDTDPEQTGDIHDQELHDTVTAAEQVWDTSLSADGRLVLSGDNDGIARLWDVATGELLHTMICRDPDTFIVDANIDSAFHVALSADGSLGLSAGGDDITCFWNTATGELLNIASRGRVSFSSASLTADGRFALMQSGRDNMYLWNVTFNSRTRVMSSPVDIENISLSANGRIALSVGESRTVLVWDAATGERLHVMDGHTGHANDVSLSADGRLALSGSDDRTIRLWDTTTGQLLRTMTGHTGSIHSVSLAADGRLALSGSRDGTGRLWDTTTGDLLRTVHKEYGLLDISLSADGRFASSRGAGVLQLWRIGRSRAVGTPSTAIAVADAVQTVDPGTEVTLDGSGSRDTRNRALLTYYWQQTAGSEIYLVPDDTAVTTFYAPTVTTDTTFTFMLTVTDSRGLIATDEVSITVSGSSTGASPPSRVGVAPNDGTVPASDAASSTHPPSLAGIAPRSKLTANSNNALNAARNADVVCASYIDEDGQTARGQISGKHCIYDASFLDAENPLEVDMTIPALSNGGIHVFQGSLIVGRSHDVETRLVQSGSSPTLTVEAGAVVAFENASGSLIVNRGARLLAVGTASMPITFTSHGEFDHWSGMQFHGSSSDDSGRLEYVVVKHAGAGGAGSIELRNVGSGTVIKNLQVYDSQGDGIVLSGGSVPVENFVAVYAHGDSIDIRRGWSGSIANALVIQPERGGDHCLNARGDQGQSIITGLTCITSPRVNADGTGNLGAGFRLGAGIRPVIEHSIVIGTFVDDTDPRSNYCLHIDNHSPHGSSALNGNVFACEDKASGSPMPDDTTVEAYVANRNNQFADVEAPTDPTSITDTELQLLGGTPPVYSLDYDDLRINGADTTITPPDGIDFPGAASESATLDWLRPSGIDWTYGIFEGSRAKPLWFEASK